MLCEPCLPRELRRHYYILQKQYKVLLPNMMAVILYPFHKISQCICCGMSGAIFSKEVSEVLQGEANHSPCYVP